VNILNEKNDRVLETIVQILSEMNSFTLQGFMSDGEI